MDIEDLQENEPLIDGINALPSGDYIAPPAPPELRERVWRSTAAIVRARPRRRRMVFGCCLLVAYAAGMATVRIAGSAGGSPEPGTLERSGPSVARVSGEAGEPAPASPAAEPLPANPAALEKHLAALPRPERTRLLKQAGDRYLSEDLDLVNALYCYRKVLKTEEQGPAEPGETWFLQALRLARMQEVKREPKDG